jgi:hypothetical protein
LTSIRKKVADVPAIPVVLCAKVGFIYLVVRGDGPK